MPSCITRLGGWLLMAFLTAGAPSLDHGRPPLFGAEPQRSAAPPKEKKATPTTIEPRLAQSTLQIGRQVLKPIQVVTPWRHEFRTAHGRIAVDKDTVTSRRGPNDKPLWVAKSADGHHLQWLTTDGPTGYFRSFLVNRDGRFQRYSPPAHVRRLDLKTGRWLANLNVPLPDRKDHRADAVLTVLASDKYVAVLSTQIKTDGESDPTVIAYQVSCFDEGKNKPKWSKTFPSVGERSKPGVYLFSSHNPDYAESSLQHLAWMGDELLVCPEPVQPIRCLNRDTGSSIWELERPWEFERGFIGPSVWSHYLGRRDASPAARKKFDEEYSCAIVGGPVVVPLPFSRGWLDTHSIFVAVAKGPAKALGGYVSDCILYEFNDRGQPVSTVKLPYMLRGSQCVRQKDGVVWMCQNDSLVRLAVAEQSGQGMGMGPGGPDLLTPILWLRRVIHRQPHAWLVADRAAHPFAFGATHAYFLPAGGYIDKRDDSVYHFPVSAVDLQTGAEQVCLLRVPLRGKVPKPTENYRGASSPRGRPLFRKIGPYLLAVTQLHLEGSVLEITLGMKNWSACLHFDLDKVGAFRPAEQVDPENDSIEEWVKSLGNVNKRAAGGRTPLLDVSGEVDARYVKALLKAGADPKSKSKNGWTPLMYAACYGTAEVVQLLINARSDVNARDNNCGGQTVLMWAAGGLREQKMKVQALIKAGADPKATLADGWTVLMSATRSGQLPTVEFLLETGLDANARTKSGQTALMIAAGHHKNISLVPVLLGARADLKARDHKGQTALMYAVKEGCLANIEALLKAGADVSAKDKAAKTALDLARESESGDSEARIKLLEAAMKQKRPRK